MIWAFQKSDEHLDMPCKVYNTDCDAQPLDCFMGVSILKCLSVHIITNSMLIDFMFYTYNAAVTTSDIYDCRMFRSIGAGSNIPHGLSSRRAVTLCPIMGQDSSSTVVQCRNRKSNLFFCDTGLISIVRAENIHPHRKIGLFFCVT